MLDREVHALCPTCSKSIKGKIYVKEEKVFLEKECPEHGIITDLLSSDSAMWLDRMSLLDHVYPNPCSVEKCKTGIFRCRDHVARKSPLAFIEITTRCNMKCPVCYADAESKGKDMPLGHIDRILDKIVEEDPKTHVILIGGEPTIHKDFFEILGKIRAKGLMKRAFIATNAITLADREFAKKVHEAGIKKFFLAFDGTDREACKKIRGSYISYDSLRKALRNIRENGKAWIIASITAVKDLNVEDIPKAIEFAMDNADIVRRIMISPEVYCGRIDRKDDLSSSRLTGDCVETYLRKELDVKAATVSLSFIFALLQPLKSMGFLDPESWMAAVPSPFCGNMGFVWQDKENRFHSLIDLFVRDADTNVYGLGRDINRLADQIARARSRFTGGLLGRLAWRTAVYTYYLPRYLFLLLGRMNKKGVFGALGSLFRAGFSLKKFKAGFFGKRRMEIVYLLGSDRYNYIWDKMPYCLTQHYRIHPRTDEVVKIPGCFVFAFREELES